jgi:hypothetical protein
LYGGVSQDGVVEESGDGAGEEAASEAVERLRRGRRRRRRERRRRRRGGRTCPCRKWFLLDGLKDP